MKKFLLITISILGLIQSQSQEYTNPENVWIYTYLSPSEEKYFMMSWGEDDVINGESVKTLAYTFYRVWRINNEINSVSGPYGEGSIKLKLADDGVYIYNSDRDAFEFVFDFNAEVGDIWDQKTYFDYDCYNMEPFHIEYAKIVNEIETIDGISGPIEIIHTSSIGNYNNGYDWYNGVIYKNIGPRSFYTICVEPLDILDVHPEYSETCATDYCFSTISGLKYFADENGAHINNLEPELLSEMLSIHNQTKPQLEFTISPNPVNDILNIETDHHIAQTVIYNAQGKQVIEQNGNANQIKVSPLPHGVYFVVIKTDEGIDGTQKFIKN